MGTSAGESRGIQARREQEDPESRNRGDRQRDYGADHENLCPARSTDAPRLGAPQVPVSRHAQYRLLFENAWIPGLVVIHCHYIRRSNCFPFRFQPPDTSPHIPLSTIRPRSNISDQYRQRARRDPLGMVCRPSAYSRKTRGKK